MTKIAVTHLPSPTVVAGRLVAGAAILICLLLIVTRRLPHGRRTWLFFFFIAAIGNTAPFLLISWGQRFIDSGLAGILMACMPLFTLVLAHFCLPDERMTPTRVAGLVFGFGGVVVLIGPDWVMNAGEHAGQPVAMLAVLAGAACYAVAAVLARRRLGSLLLDQRFLAGIGNYLRSEILFKAGLHPRLRPIDCRAEALERLARAAVAVSRQSYRHNGITNDLERARQLRAQGQPRSRYRHWVFARGNRPCRVCGASIVQDVAAGRRIYFCPTCQRERC